MAKINSNQVAKPVTEIAAGVSYRCTEMLERLRARWQKFRSQLTWSLAWDLFMVYLALLNLGLILFDLTYLWLRPQYFRRLPTVIRLYDPVKGIEPHPVTDEYLELTQRLGQELAAGKTVAVEGTLRKLGDLSLAMVAENPFERSGQERSLIRLFVGMKAVLEQEGVVMGETASEEVATEEIASRFWSLKPSPAQLGRRLKYFNENLAPLLEVNYHRTYDRSGKLTDHFWRLDLPFLLIFATEFFVRWYLALRRRTYSRWFFFPILNWYDILGILPVRQLRFFRLFRVVSIYLRLSRSEHSIVGDDFISRTIKYVANIITEEISDMVALRILNETQEELREGTHKRIIRAVADTHRDALAAQLALQTRDLLANDEVRQQAREFLDANLEQAVESAAALRMMPVPDVLLRPLVNIVGQAVFNAFADTLEATLSSAEGQEAVRTMIAETVDGLVSEITEGELEELVREISIEVIGHMKETVAVRKWALPDRPPRTIFTRDLVD